jgi:hypothetical protein
MKKDVIVDEIRKFRHEHAARFNFKVDDICADLKKKEKNCGHRVVSLPPKHFLKKTGS